MFDRLIEMNRHEVAQPIRGAALSRRRARRTRRMLGRASLRMV